MSRHRNVRSMNYHDEYDGYDDVYGHSVEDDYCVSPGTAATYMFDRTQNQALSNFFGKNEGIPEENEEDDSQSDPLQDSSNYKRPKLNDVDDARLNSCLEELRNILGESTPEHVMVDAVINHNFDYEKALDSLLSHQEAPKPQRQQRANRRNKAATEDSSFPVQGRAQPGFILGEPPSKAKTSTIQSTEKNVNVNLPQSVARMTFSSGSTAKSGFTPEKEDTAAEGNKEAIENVKKKINVDNMKKSETINGSVSSSASVEVSAEPVRLKQETGASGDVGLTPNRSFSKSRFADLESELEKRKMAGKDYINLVVIGHVDAGKSTLMGHTLYQLGFVNKKTMHRYEQDAKKMGKASFAFAWVLDETEEERTRGVTMDVAQTRFETDSKIVTLLDAPGHKDFIPNMITGAAQADVAVLVVNSTKGEFETGFESGGQTREHAMLIRSLGVYQLVVAINKMDTVDWSQDRYQEIVKTLGTFLKQAGFKESDVTFIPCSGLSGENLVKQPTDEKLASWYKGPTIIHGIDAFKAPERDINKPLRMCVSDVFKGMGAGFCVSGTLQAGSIQAGDKILVMPQGEMASCKVVAIDNYPVPIGFAGDNVTVTLTGIDMTNIAVGSILCDPSSPIKSASRIQARVVLFNIDVPLTKGFPVIFHYQALSEPAHITKLVSQLHKSSGEVVRNKPRCLTKNSNAVIELVIDRPVCIELYKDFKDLGRFMLRYGGHTIAAGLVTEIKQPKAARGD